MMRTLAALAVAASLHAELPRFEEHTLATDLKGGYQVVLFDVNRDGKKDIIALASGMPDLYWFENPGWQRHVLATGFRRMINVAACDGVDEMIVAHEFANTPKGSIGIVSVITPGADRTQPWTVREIDRLTTSHRLRCADIDGSGRKVFVNAPLAGAKAAAPDYRDHVPLVYYKPGEWKRMVIGEENEGVVHGIFIEPRPRGGDCILTASFVGLHRYCLDAGRWNREELAKGDPTPWPKSGSSDVAMGHLRKRPFLAAIESWHGKQVVIYTQANKHWQRQVIDAELSSGHTIVAADLDGDGRDEVIAGHRGPGTVGVNLYQSDKAGARWTRTILDDKMAASACAGDDLDGDKHPDIVCIGSATTNLKLYSRPR
ncbi:MAG: VCBS repeat-containing protein [Bryobacteraceae bacterium]